MKVHMGKNKLEPTLVGVSGEYFVAAELSRRGYIASITLRNSRGIDIIVSSSDGKKSASIQVKTNSDGSCNWILNKKSEEFYSDNHYYVFVSLQDINKHPNFHIVESKVVAQKIKNDHKKWLSEKKANGEPRKDSTMRKFSDNEKKYLDKWNIIAI